MRYEFHPRVFPYAVLYSIEDDFILIVAVMHCSREPGYWKTRVAPPVDHLTQRIDTAPPEGDVEVHASDFTPRS